MGDLRTNIVEMATKMEEDCRIVRNAHWIAARVWERVHFGIGLAAVIVGVLGGGSAGTGVVSAPNAALAGVFAAGAGLLAATLGFLKPAERVEQHKRAADAWAGLRYKFWLLYSARVPVSPAKIPEDELQTELNALVDKMDETTQGSPIVSTNAIDKGETEMRLKDQRNSESSVYSRPRIYTKRGLHKALAKTQKAPPPPRRQQG